jgi:hypothetical protein
MAHGLAESNMHVPKTRMEQKIRKLKSGIVAFTILYSFMKFLNVEILPGGHSNKFLIGASNSVLLSLIRILS